MSDEFRRLLDDSADSPLHGVLEAGLRDRPTPRHLARAARALGIGAAGLGAAQAAAAAESARAAHAPLWAAFAKWGAAGMLLGGAALSPLVLSQPAPPPVYAAQRSPQQASAAAQSAASASLAPALTAARTQAPEPAKTHAAPSAHSTAQAPEAQRASALAAELPAGSLRRPTRGPQPSAGAARTSNLDAEVALLDSARSALKQNDPSTALSWLDRHSQLSAPTLAAEATLLRVRALIAADRAPEAQTVARRAIDGESRSAYAERLSKLAGLTDE